MDMDTTQVSLKVSSISLTCYATIWLLTTYLQNEDSEASSVNEVTYQVIIAIVQAAICGIIAYQMCANHFLSLCNKVTVTTLVIFELVVFASGVGLFVRFTNNSTG